MKAFSGSAELKADILAAMADDTTVKVDLADTPRAYGFPAWWEELAEKLLEGLPPDLQAKFPQALIKATPVGADLGSVRDDFAVLALTCALGLDPSLKPAKALLVAWHTRDMDADTKAYMDGQRAALRRIATTRGVQVRASERAIKNASNLPMRLSTEKTLAAHVIACEAARAASLHATPRAMIEPLGTAVAARVWLETISLLQLPDVPPPTGNIKARRDATEAAWIALAGADRSDGTEDAYAFLATELLKMTLCAK